MNIHTHTSYSVCLCVWLNAWILIIGCFSFRLSMCVRLMCLFCNYKFFLAHHHHHDHDDDSYDAFSLVIHITCVPVWMYTLHVLLPNVIFFLDNFFEKNNQRRQWRLPRRWWPLAKIKKNVNQFFFIFSQRKKIFFIFKTFTFFTGE